jgi:uncharacterized protein YbjT (DUF2867 family)
MRIEMGIKPLHSDMQPYSAVVLGSTGNVGREVVKLLAVSPAVRLVVVVNRRQADEFIDTPKVSEVVVPDMDKLAETVESTAREAGATVGFCAIGIGKGSLKMPEAEVRKIEVQYPEAFAKGCKAGGVLSLGLMTAAGADGKSRFTNVRIMGEKEDAVSSVGLAALGIYRPSVILGNSNTPSYLNYVFPALQWMLPSRFHGIHKSDLAGAMVEGTQRALAELQGGANPKPEIRLYEYREMKLFCDRDEPKD